MTMGLLKAGDHVIVSQSVFGSTIQMFVNIFKKFGLESTFVSATDVSAWEKAVKPNTKLMFLEKFKGFVIIHWFHCIIIK